MSKLSSTGALAAIITAARDLKRAAAAVAAVEGEDPAILNLMEDRVQALAASLWALEGGGVADASRTVHATTNAPAFRAGLFSLPVLMLAMQRRPLSAPVFLGDVAEPGTDPASLTTDPAWRWCENAARDIADGILKALEGAEEVGRVA